MLRSWENRPDTMVVDEPFYGFYLKATGADHPGREDVVASMETDWRVIAEDLKNRHREGVGIFYQKQMAHHMLPDVKMDWVESMHQVFLIREPSEMIPSLHEKLSDFTVEATGLPVQVALFERLKDRGEHPAVLDAKRVLKDPEGQLRALCGHLDVPFLQEMLGWPTGARESDGVWAVHWYANVEKSSGFQAYRPKNRTIPPHLQGVFEEAKKLYGLLQPYCL